MKRYLYIIILIPFLCFGQTESFDFEQNVTGIVSTSEGSYLIVKQGFIKISEANIYTEYYRTIYNDSTLINPNTEIKSDHGLNIIPFILPNQKQRRIDFKEPYNIGVFVRMNENGKLNITSDGSDLIDSLLIPQPK